MKEHWLRLQYSMGRDAMERVGPTLPVKIRASADREWIDAVAQIDTGAGTSAISPRLFPILGAPVIDEWTALVANQEAETVPIVRAGLRLEKGPEIHLHYAVLRAVDDPHDVLIGRDFLDCCRLNVSFAKGHFELQLGLHLMDKVQP